MCRPQRRLRREANHQFVATLLLCVASFLLMPLMALLGVTMAKNFALLSYAVELSLYAAAAYNAIALPVAIYVHYVDTH